MTLRQRISIAERFYQCYLCEHFNQISLFFERKMFMSLYLGAPSQNVLAEMASSTLQITLSCTRRIAVSAPLSLPGTKHRIADTPHYRSFFFTASASQAPDIVILMTLARLAALWYVSVHQVSPHATYLRYTAL